MHQIHVQGVCAAHATGRGGGSDGAGGTWHDWPTASNAAGRDAAMPPALTDHARRGDSTSLTKGDLDGNRLAFLQLSLALLLDGCTCGLAAAGASSSGGGGALRCASRRLSGC